MKRLKAILVLGMLWLWAGGTLTSRADAQVNQNQQLAFAGLRAVATRGQFNAVKTDAAGNLYLLLDQNDGVRILKTDNAGANVLAQALLGASGDVGQAMALDPQGNVYVTGTTTSSTLSATSGAAISTRTDTTTNSFVAKFDASLTPLFVSFTGGSKIAASAIAATSDAVFITGGLFTATLPVTSGAFQTAPATGTFQNGFVEKFSASGATLLYATYLTGASGDTMPTAIAADSSDAAYVTGSTASANYPSSNALVPVMIGTSSGFITALNPAGSAVRFSTFVPGPGLTSIALDSSGQTLLASGSVDMGKFPVSTVATPLVPLNYQVLLRLPVSGASVQSATVLAPGQQSTVAPGSDGSVWVDGVLAAPVLPSPTLSALGVGYAMRVTSSNTIDQVARFGGLPNAHATFASLPVNITSLAVTSAGEALIAGSMQPTASSSILATETYDLPLLNNLTPALPSTIRAAEVSASDCSGSLCAGSAAYLAKLNVASAVPSLIFSADDSPWLVLRNFGSAQATNLQLSASGATLASNCSTTLAAGGECDVLLSGSGAATVSASASNATTQSVSVSAFAAPASTIVFYPKELDFGVQTSASASNTRVITVSNLGTTSQSFASAIDSSARTASPFTEVTSDCLVNNTSTAKILAAGATCHITLGFAASSSSANDGALTAYWSIGSRDVMLTGYSQAAALSVSANKMDFGTQYPSGIQLPRYLYLSNNSSTVISHQAATLNSTSPFTLTDHCPATLAAKTICQIRVDYLSTTIPSSDSTTLTLDQGLSVLLAGQTLTQPVVNGPAPSSDLSVAPTSVTFATPVVVTGVSSNTQTVSISNSGTSALALTLALTGDYTQVTSCTASLPAGQTCAVSITFAPSQTGIRQGLLAVTAGASSPVYVSLSGTGTAILTSATGTLDFGSEPLGQPTAQFFKIAQSFSSLTARATGPYSVALIADLGYGPGQPPTSAYSSSATGSCASCYLAVQFNPQTAGPQPGTLTLSSAASGIPYTFNLTGIGLPVTGLVLTPLTQDFGSVPVKSTGGMMMFTLTNANASGSAISISSPVLTGDFAVSSSATAGQPCSSSLSPTASCVLGLVFSPTATGTRSGTIAFNASGTTISSNLKGFGTTDPGLTINPVSLTFSNIAGTAATQQSLTLTNTSAATMAIGTLTTTTASFQTSGACATLAAGANCTITVTFQPGNASVQDVLSIPVQANGSTSVTTYTVALNGSYTAASAGINISPAQTSFGAANTGVQGATRQFTISNLSGRDVTLATVVPRQFVLTGAPCLTLAAGGSCTLQFQFVPLTNGDITGTVVINATSVDGSASSQAMAYVEGFGVSQSGALTVSGNLQTGNVLDFGQVASGQTATRTITLTNSSTTTTVITVHRITSGPPFLSTSNCSTSLAAGAFCTVTLTYTPVNQVAGGTAASPSTSDTGVLRVESDASSSPEIINITGQAGPVAGSGSSGASALATFTLSQSSFSFANTLVGTSSTAQTVTLQNTGNVPVHVLAATASADFLVQNPCSVLVANANCTLTVTFSPKTAGTRISALEIATDSTASLEFISLIGVAAPQTLTLTPASLDFGSLVLGASTSLSATLTNTAAAPATIANIAATGDYAIAGNCPAAGATLPANASCNLSVTFSPTRNGTRTGTLSVTTPTSTVPLTTSLTGVGQQSQLTTNPATLDFGSVQLGSTSKLALTLANTGTAPVTNLALSITGDYAITIPCQATTLAPNDSCTLQLTFTPSAAATRTSALTITSSDHNSPQQVPLTGVGVPGPTFSLAVNGGSSATVTVLGGSPASYTLTATPSGGFTGPIALTCDAVNSGLYVTCSLQPSTLTLTASAQTATATLNTITTQAGLLVITGRIVVCLLLPCIVFFRGKRRRVPAMFFAVLLSAILISMSGCGGSSQPATAAPPSNIHSTPPGTYQYLVTATSTGGAQLTRTVTLNLVVQ